MNELLLLRLPISRLLPRNEERWKPDLKFQKKLSLLRRPVHQTLSKTLGISVHAKVLVGIDLLKVPAILLIITVWISAIKQGNLKPYLKSEKKYFFEVVTLWYFLAADFFPTLSNARTSDKAFQQSEKHNSFNTHWRDQLRCMKVKAHSSSEPPLESNHYQKPWRNQI